jgi:hypothetical protein
MTCPYCQYTFPLTWPRYFKATFGRHTCPACAKVSRQQFKFSHFLILLAIGLICTVPGVILIVLLTSNFDFWAVLGAIPMILVVFPLDRLMDAKFKQLKKIEGQESPSATSPCAECHRIFSIDHMITHQGVHICARCKPIFLQKLAEGAQINRQY